MGNAEGELAVVTRDWEGETDH